MVAVWQGDRPLNSVDNGRSSRHLGCNLGGIKVYLMGPWFSQEECDTSLIFHTHLSGFREQCDSLFLLKSEILIPHEVIQLRGGRAGLPDFGPCFLDSQPPEL